HHEAEHKAGQLRSTAHRQYPSSTRTGAFLSSNCAAIDQAPRVGGAAVGWAGWGRKRWNGSADWLQGTRQSRIATHEFAATRRVVSDLVDGRRLQQEEEQVARGRDRPL